MKLNILPRILFLPLLLILLTSCNKWLDNEFFPLYDARYPAYEKGDTFMYKNIVTEEVDTFVVTNFVLDTLFNGTYLYEQTSTSFGKIVEDTLSDDIFYVGNEPYGAFFVWDSSYVYFSNITDDLDTTIQGFDYSKLYIAEDTRNDSSDTDLHKIYFDWKYGLVKYTYNSLDTYELFYRPE